VFVLFYLSTFFIQKFCSSNFLKNSASILYKNKRERSKGNIVKRRSITIMDKIYRGITLSGPYHWSIHSPFCMVEGREPISAVYSCYNEDRKHCTSIHWW